MSREARRRGKFCRGGNFGRKTETCDDEVADFQMARLNDDGTLPDQIRLLSPHEMRQHLAAYSMPASASQKKKQATRRVPAMPVLPR